MLLLLLARLVEAAPQTAMRWPTLFLSTRSPTRLSHDPAARQPGLPMSTDALTLAVLHGFADEASTFIVE
jgi:hypothetical protein